MKSKFRLRQDFLNIRKKIPDSYRLESAEEAAKIFVTHPDFNRSEHIACYLAFKDEFDPSFIISNIWKHKKKCYLPVLSDKEKILSFVRYQYGDALKRNQYSILEPVNVSQKINAEQLDLVITPLLAFDLKGHRLGTGGGYYDTTFAFVNEKKLKRPLILVGLAYANQQADEIPADPWDVNLSSVITEKKIITVKI